MDEMFMRRCIELAEQAKEKGNVPVGCVIVLNGEVIAEAEELVPVELTVTGHAEVIAVQKACEVLGSMDLSECVMVTTAEPCWMCSYAIRETGIKRVVIGAETLSVGAVSTKYKLLVDGEIEGWGTPPEVVMGVLREECLRLRE